MKNKTTNKVVSVLVIAMMLSCAAGMVVADAGNDTEEADAIFWTPATAILLGAIIGVVGTVSAQKLASMLTQQQGQQEVQTRTSETNAVAQSIAVGMGYYDNALANYKQIWAFTDEHWIRQAELAASFKWEADATFSPYTVLSDAGVYLNSAYMIQNASAQVNMHFSSMSERLALWNNTPTYQGKMAIGWTYGGTENMSKTAFGGSLGTTITVTSGDYDKAYLSGGTLYASVSGTLKSASGTILNVVAGNNNLSSLPGWKADVYEFSPGAYHGTILKVNDPEAVAVHAGLLMVSGDNVKLATYKSGKAIIGGSQYNDLSIRITPDGGTTQTRSVMAALSGMEAVIGTVNTTMDHASDASLAVWNIFTRAGQACTYVTTLTVPSIYHNMTLSVAQRECITVLAMEQLHAYYKDNGGRIKQGDYKLSDGSMQLFCRGDLYDHTGKKLYSNVVYTPFFYQSDVTLANGNNTLSQPAIVALWDDQASALSSWSSTSHMDRMTLVSLKTGSKIDVYEQQYNGAMVQSVALKITNVDLIDGNRIDPTPIPVPPSPPKKDDLLVKVIILIIAALVIIMGIMRYDPIIIIVGLVLVLVGWYATPWIMGLIG